MKVQRLTKHTMITFKSKIEVDLSTISRKHSMSSSLSTTKNSFIVIIALRQKSMKSSTTL